MLLDVFVLISVAGCVRTEAESRVARAWLMCARFTMAALTLSSFALQLQLTCGTLVILGLSVVLFIVSSSFKLPLDAFSVDTGVFLKGQVHKLLTYPFFHKALSPLLLSAGVLLPFGGGLERGVGTLRFLYLLFLLGSLAALLYASLELLLLWGAGLGQSQAHGLLPPTLALMGVATVDSPMRKALVMGVAVPTMALPWLVLLLSCLIPDTAFLCNIIALILGEMYGKGWLWVLNMSETRASRLERKMPFRLLRRLLGVMFVPASREERQKTLHPPCNPTPGSYPVQAYAPLLPTQLPESVPQTYEGWQHATYTQRSSLPPSMYPSSSMGHIHSAWGQDASCDHSLASPQMAFSVHLGGNPVPQVDPGRLHADLSSSIPAPKVVNYTSLLPPS